MKGCFFRCDWKASNLLYIPQNLIVMEDETEDTFEIKYSPRDLKIFQGMLKRKEPILIRNIEYKLEKEVQIPDKLLEEFQEACFNGNGLEAHGAAMAIFLTVKN